MQSQVVFGAGLIGCYLGAVLTRIAQQKAEHTVVLYARPSVAGRIRNGLQLTDYHDNSVSIERLNVETELAGLSANPIDVIWLTVKCTTLDSALDDIAQVIKPNTVIICCQNGLDSHTLVEQRFPEHRVLRVMVPFNVVEQRDGHYHRGSEGRLTLQSSDLDDELLKCLLHEAVNNGSETSILPFELTCDMTALQWAKLQLNLGNSVNALANIPVKAMLEQRGYRRVIAAMMAELIAVTDTMELTLPKVAAVKGPMIPWILRLPNMLFKRVANKMLAIDPNVRTSMWWDLQQGRKTEIDFLNNAVVRYAKELDVECPVNEKIVRLIHQAEEAGSQHEPIDAASLCDAVGLR